MYVFEHGYIIQGEDEEYNYCYYYVCTVRSFGNWYSTASIRTNI